MRVRFIQSIAGPGFYYKPGEWADLEDNQARRLVAAGVAEEAPADFDLTAPESAVVAAPETAMAPRARPSSARIPAGLRRGRVR